MARDLLKEVLNESWAKSASWGEKDGWEWVKDLGGPGALAGVGDDSHNWRAAIATMSAGGGAFRDDKQRERVGMWNQCWEAVRTARSEAMIAEEQVCRLLLFSSLSFPCSRDLELILAFFLHSLVPGRRSRSQGKQHGCHLGVHGSSHSRPFRSTSSPSQASQQLSSFGTVSRSHHFYMRSSC